MSLGERLSELGVCAWSADSRRHEGGRKFRKAGVKVSRFAFSLSELLVAIGILGVGLLMLAAAFPVGIDQVRRAVELSTSEMVFNEAVNNLKTRVTPSELEAYMGDTTSPKVPNADPTKEIWLLNFDATLGVNRIFANLHQNPSASPLIPSDLVYSGANSYAWQAAVQRVGSAGGRCYRFWIFVVREPTGIINSTGDKLRALFEVPPISVTAPGGNILQNVTPKPNRGQFLLGSDGEVYKVTDAAADPSVQTIKVDRDAAGLATNGSVTFITGITGAQLTRRAPTVAVYQTVVTY